MSEKEFDSQLKRINIENVSKRRRAILNAERKKYGFKFKLPSTSKLVLLGIFLLCLEIVIFSEYAMIVLGDTSAMYALIGIPTALVPAILAYYNKSKAENTTGGIVYESAIRQNQSDEENEDLSGNDTLG